jgi:hypothetical protein
MPDPRYVNVMVALALLMFAVLAFTFLRQAPV